jgi:hypothetical protein
VKAGPEKMDCPASNPGIRRINKRLTMLAPRLLIIDAGDKH